MKLDFKCGGKLVGCFADLDEYPTKAGRYKYIAYRGPGHLLLREECKLSGFARCTYEANGSVQFIVRTVAMSTGLVDVDEIAVST